MLLLPFLPLVSLPFIGLLFWFCSSSVFSCGLLCLLSSVCSCLLLFSLFRFPLIWGDCLSFPSAGNLPGFRCFVLLFCYYSFFCVSVMRADCKCLFVLFPLVLIVCPCVTLLFQFLTLFYFRFRFFHPFCGSVRLGLLSFYSVFMLALLLSPVA